MAELVRKSKHEARDAAIALARASTGRTTVIAVPTPYSRASLIWLRQTIANACEPIAALVVDIEPGDVANHGRMLKKACELASANGALLIWCETAVAAGTFQDGMRAVYRITPDLTCLTLGSASWLYTKKEATDHEMPV